MMDNNSQPKSDLGEKSSCIVCRAQIELGASKCKECNSYQANWKNILSFVAGNAVVLTVTASAMAFLLKSLPEVRKATMWRDSIEVLSFVNGRNFTVSNVGDGTVFIEYIEIIRPMGDSRSASTTIYIGSEVKSGETLNKSFDDTTCKGGSYVKGGDSPETDEWVAIANKAIAGNQGFCLDIRDIDDPPYKQIVEHYRRVANSTVMTLPHTARVHFYSLKQSKNMVHPFEIVALVVQIGESAPAESQRRSGLDAEQGE